MPTPPVAVADFKTQFPREFVYGSKNSEVLDADIQRALYEATMVFNSDLWEDTVARNIAFLYASAHLMVLNLQVSGGLSITNTNYGVKSKGGGTVISKSVGGVAVQFVLPPSITEDKMLSGFMHTDFGQRYLQLLTPRLVGACFVVEGFSDDSFSNQAFLDSLPVTPAVLSTGNFDIDTASDIVLYGQTVPHYMFYVMSTTEVSARIIIARNGTINGLLVRANSNTLNGATVFTVLKNGVAQALTATLAVTAVDCQDAVGTFTVVAGDEIDIKVDPTAATTGKLLAIRATIKLA